MSVSAALGRRLSVATLATAMFPDPPSGQVVLLCETCSGGLREISNRTDTDLEWETKQNRGVNVQSILYANVECDSQ